PSVITAGGLTITSASVDNTQLTMELNMTASELNSQSVFNFTTVFAAANTTYTVTVNVLNEVGREMGGFDITNLVTQPSDNVATRLQLPMDSSPNPYAEYALNEASPNTGL